MNAAEEFLIFILEQTRKECINWHLDSTNDNPNILAKYIATYKEIALQVGKSLLNQAPYYFSATFPGNVTGNLFPLEMENPYRLKALYECASKPNNEAFQKFLDEIHSSDKDSEE